MPVPRSRAEILCLALCILARGQIEQSLMLQTIAVRLNIPLDQALEMATEAEKAGLITLLPENSVTLTVKGRERGVALTASAARRHVFLDTASPH